MTEKVDAAVAIHAFPSRSGAYPLPQNGRHYRGLSNAPPHEPRPEAQLIMSAPLNSIPRRIVGFRQDEAGDWIADLECGHSQHVRHRPPWFVRPWVVTQAGRENAVGRTLDCRLCASTEHAEDPS